MIDMTKKSLGTLIDELFTATLKCKHRIPGADTRRLLLEATLETAFDDHNLLGDKMDQLEIAINCLEAVVKKCWDAQEIVMGGDSDKVIASAARDAQRLNGERNKFISEIDEIVGDVPPLEKSYVLRTR